MNDTLLVILNWLLQTWEIIVLNVTLFMDAYSGLPRVVFGAFAIYRIVGLLVFDDGPWDIFERIRKLFGVYTYGPNGKQTTMLGKLLSCAHCTGIWVTIAFFFVIFNPTIAGDLIIAFFGLAGVQSALTSDA